MTEKVAIVTGAGQGLGRAVARALADAGYRVALLGRTAAKIEAVRDEIGAAAIAVPLDLADPAAVEAAFGAMEAAFGRLDVLVNNAASYRPFALAEATPEQLRETVDGTLMSALYCIRQAIPRMTSSGGGEIVSVTSESVHMPAPFLTLYAAAKAALETVHMGLRNELRGTGIRSMVFETGRITESSAGEHWDPEIMARFGQIYVEQGYAAMLSSNAVTPTTLAATIVHMITAPREANLELVRMRARD